jgi:phage-related protein (TIGR01555 family)
MPKLPKPVQGKVSVRGAARKVARDNNALARKQAEASAARLADKIEKTSGVTALDAATWLTSDSFQNFALSLGMGTDNTMSASTYGFNPITRQRILLEWLYRGTWLGGMAIDLPADDMTRAGVDLRGEMTPDDIEKMQEQAQVLGVWEAVNDTIRWSRLYGGCLGVLLIEGQRYDTPLRIETIGKGGFKGIAVLDRWMVEPTIGDLVKEPGPSMGLPKYYRITDDAPIRIQERIHYSRVIRLEGVRLPYYQRLMENLWGMSTIERLYDRLTMFDAATAGASQLIHKSFLRTLKMKGLREALAAGGKAAKGVIAQVSMMRRFQQNEGISVVDGDDEFDIAQSSGIAGMADMLGRFGEQISGALQIPLVRLFGQSPAGFSSGESDLRMYYDGIRQQQRRHLQLPMTRVFRCIAMSEGIKIPSGFGVEFRPLWQLTEKEQAETAVVVTNAINEAIQMGVISKSTAMKELRQSSEVTGIFTNITDEDIEAAEKEDAVMEPPAPGEGVGAAFGLNQPGAEAPPSGEQPGKPPEAKPAPFASAAASKTPKSPAKVAKKEEASGVQPTPGAAAENKAEETGPAEHPPANVPGGEIEHKNGAPPEPKPGEKAKPKGDDLPQFDGLDYFIETPKGQIRQPWGVTMPAHYGYIRGTGSAEGWGEGMDCYVGDNAKAKHVYVVHQKDLDSGKFDEHKCLLGFSGAGAAMDAYIKSFNDGKGRDRIIKVEAYSPDAFKKWLRDNWRVEARKAEGE